jgi:magnesium transporter
MRKIFRTPRSLGHPPGSLIPIEKEELTPLKLTVFEYGPDHFLGERQCEAVTGCFPFNTETPVTWLHITGSHQVKILEEIGSELIIHPLVLENILDTSQRPKLEDFETYLLIELNLLIWDEQKDQVGSEQVSIILSDDYVITIQEHEKGVFDPIRKRIREDKGRLVKQGTDYLAYSLIDTIVDHYFMVLENIGEQIEVLEEKLMFNPDPATLYSIHELKRELIFLRKSVWPLREVIGAIERDNFPIFQDSTLIYLRDVYDHTIQVIETIETFRDMVTGMLDIYLSSVNNRMNEVMKTLTIITTLFMPLSFLTGFFGMNFFEAAFPFEAWTGKLAFTFLLAGMIVTPVSMYLWMRRRAWM